MCTTREVRRRAAGYAAAPAIALACAILLLPFAGGAQTRSAQSAPTVAIPGAGPPEALLRALADDFGRRHPQVRIDVPPSTGQSGALDAVRSGAAPLGRLPRRLSEAEQREGLGQTVIAKEAIVFAAGSGVSVSGLARAQLAGIFSGAIKDWSEVGGGPGPVRVLYREETEGLLQRIRRDLPGFAKLQFPASGRMLNRDYETIDMLQRFDWAVGWATLSNARAGKGPRVLAIDGVAPEPANLRDARYPLVYEAVLIYKGTLAEVGKRMPYARQFVEFARSAHGVRLIDSLGALPPESNDKR